MATKRQQVRIDRYSTMVRAAVELGVPLGEIMARTMDHHGNDFSTQVLRRLAAVED